MECTGGKEKAVLTNATKKNEDSEKNERVSDWLELRRWKWIVKGKLSESNESLQTKATQKNEVVSEE